MPGTLAAEAAGWGATLGGNVVVRKAVEAEAHECRWPAGRGDGVWGLYSPGSAHDDGFQ
jgi:hypothetical protein